MEHKNKSNINNYQAKYFSYELTKQNSSDTIEKVINTIADAKIDPKPHQIEASLFAFKSPLSKGAILADEVGLGKTIEAGIVIAQNWVENKKRILIIAPATLRKQWYEELLEKFYLDSIIMENNSFNNYIKKGVFNPFDQEGIMICSYNFIKSKEVYVSKINWDLVVIDEAHRLRNVYKNSNKISKAIKESVKQSPKLLLTATPLQNSLLELYGLVSIIDDYIFGDINSFKEKFCRASENVEYQELKKRLSPICTRTLRKQVLEYINYTNRNSITQEFTPTDEEQELYDNVTAYLQRENLIALPKSQRFLMTLILRKLLASSTFAIAGTLRSLINKLNGILEKAEKQNLNENDFKDYDEYEELMDETEFDEENEEIPFTKEDIPVIKKEIEDLKVYAKQAENIKQNAKGQVLITALEKGFDKMKELGASPKALIFTESKRTQDYLISILQETQYKDKYVLYNGTNTDELSKKIYRQWLEKHKGEPIITGSATADKRSALVDYFKNEANIMIATEAAAEGINLQFCSMIVNYDLPWNPQRIEQRIGRCHRYGQKHDVVVINFLNNRNEADKRVYELLQNKFQLFDGVFGASDEILGVVESGVEFEKRISEIYTSCRKTEEIEQAFNDLQKEMEDKINEKMKVTRKNLLENFDEEVTEKLRINLMESKKYLDRQEKMLMQITKHKLNNKFARFNDNIDEFELIKNPYNDNEIKKGKYAINNKDSKYYDFRIGHRLAKNIIQEYKDVKLENNMLIFDYSNSNIKITELEKFVGTNGEMKVFNVNVSAFDNENRVLPVGITTNGEFLPLESSKRLFNLSSIVVNDNNKQQYEEELKRVFDIELSNLLGEINNKNSTFFDNEMEKLEKWSEDVKQSLEIELKNLDLEIKLKKGESKKIIKLEDKIKKQKEIKNLEKKRNTLRFNLYDEQDKVEDRKEELISNIENKMKQNVVVEELFSIKFEII